MPWRQEEKGKSLAVSDGLAKAGDRCRNEWTVLWHPESLCRFSACLYILGEGAICDIITPNMTQLPQRELTQDESRYMGLSRGSGAYREHSILQKAQHSMVMLKG